MLSVGCLKINRGERCVTCDYLRSICKAIQEQFGGTNEAYAARRSGKSFLLQGEDRTNIFWSTCCQLSNGDVANLVMMMESLRVYFVYVRSLLIYRDSQTKMYR